MTIKAGTQVGGYALIDALSGLYAYDDGAVQSGIHDESLRASVREMLRGVTAGERRVVLSTIARELYLSRAAIAQGYGLEDTASFFRWLDDQGMYL